MKSKSADGLGFRDFESFNLAMFAKQGWRLVQGHSSLALEVLKFKYFVDFSFIQNKVGSKPSFIWKSIITARHLLKERTIWRIGNGEHVEIWKDKWLPHPTAFRVQSAIKILEEDTKVQALIDPIIINEDIL